MEDARLAFADRNDRLEDHLGLAARCGAGRRLGRIDRVGDDDRRRGGRAARAARGRRVAVGHGAGLGRAAGQELICLTSCSSDLSGKTGVVQKRERAGRGGRPFKGQVLRGPPARRRGEGVRPTGSALIVHGDLPSRPRQSQRAAWVPASTVLKQSPPPMSVAHRINGSSTASSLPPPSWAAAGSVPSLSIRALLAANLAAQSALLPQLFTLTASLSTPASSSASARTQTAIVRIYGQLATLDEELAQLTERARRHAAKWERMETLKRECIAVEGEVRQRAMRLERGRRELEKLVKDARKTTEGIELARDRESPALQTAILLATKGLTRGLSRSSRAPAAGRSPVVCRDAGTLYLGPTLVRPGDDASLRPRCLLPALPDRAFDAQRAAQRRRRAWCRRPDVGRCVLCARRCQRYTPPPPHLEVSLIRLCPRAVQDLPRPETSAAAEPFVHALVQRPQPTAEVFDFDLNSDLDD